MPFWRRSAAAAPATTYETYPHNGPSRGRIAIIRLINTLTFIAAIVVNALAAATTKINGVETGDISDERRTMVTPADWAFSIWWLIYAFLALFTIITLLPQTYLSHTLNASSASLLFTLANLLNIGWVLSWNYRAFEVNLAFIYALWLTLLAIYARGWAGVWQKVWLSRRNLSHVDNVETGMFGHNHHHDAPAVVDKDGVAERGSRFAAPVKWFWMRVPWGLYFSWVTIAVLAATFSFWFRLDEGATDKSAIIGISVAGAVLLIATMANNDPIPAAVGVWAIMAMRSDEGGASAGGDRVRLTTTIVAAVLGVVGIFTAFFGLFRVLFRRH
ncbi:hypothetical protein HDV00_003038 [Rhizophlyctis rosea]|nr:hypothetical protein HDV00_003038 [Rhizophlyctis rosea]